MVAADQQPLIEGSRAERWRLTSSARVVVTGGAGFLGSHLCNRLVERGARVECWDDLSTGRQDNIAHLHGHPCFAFRRLDVCQPPPVDGVVDTVFHLASPASPMDYGKLPLATLRVGSLGTLEMLELARTKKARFVLASTSEVYGDPEQHPQHEDYYGHVNPVGSRAVYDEAKRFAEATTAAYQREYALDAGIARIFNSFGPRLRSDDGRVVPTLIQQALSGRPLTIMGSGRQTRSLCYVDDTVRGLLHLAESSCLGPVNIGSPHEMTVLEIAQTIVDLVGVDIETQHIALPDGDPTRRKADITRARELIGWQPQFSVIEGLRKTIAWMTRT